MTAKRSTPATSGNEAAPKPKRSRKAGTANVTETPAAEPILAEEGAAEQADAGAPFERGSGVDVPEKPSDDAATDQHADQHDDRTTAREAWSGQVRRIVVFGMEGQRYALPIEAVQEIQQIVAVSELPSEQGAVVGVINLRGQVVPAIDLRALVGMPSRDYTLQTPMVFTRTPRGLVALIVDDVEDVLEVPADCIQAPTGVYALADRLLGVCRLESGLVFVFDVDALLPSAGSDPRMEAS